MEENPYIEFKESEKFMHDDSLEWGKVIIGMANRYGGKIIVGKKDDGSNEGFHIFDKFSEDGKSGIDKLKEKIESFCKDRITPSILCDLYHQTENDGELLFIRVPRRKELPYAYKDQIRRIYYIKNSHGTEPVTDDTLIAWLYNEGNFYLNQEFYSLIHFYKNKILPVSDYQNSCMYSLPGIEIANRLLFPNYKDLILNNSEQQEVISFLFPYLILLTLNEKMQDGWRIKDNNTALGGSRTAYKESSVSIDLNALLKNNLKKFHASDEHTILKSIYHTGITGIKGLNKISVPLDTNISILHEKMNNSYKSVVEWTNPQFTYKITTHIDVYSAALDDPIHRTILKFMKNCNINDDKIGNNRELETYQFLVSTESEFLFLEHQRYEFNIINDYINTINKTLQENWDYYYLIENISPVTYLYSIEKKLNQVLKRIEM